MARLARARLNGSRGGPNQVSLGHCVASAEMCTGPDERERERRNFEHERQLTLAIKLFNHFGCVFSSLLSQLNVFQSVWLFLARSIGESQIFSSSICDG